MEPLYPDHTEDGFLLHSERRSYGYMIIVTDLTNDEVVEHHELSTWNEYLNKYLTITAILPGLREYRRSLLNDPEVRRWLARR